MSYSLSSRPFYPSLQYHVLGETIHLFSPVNIGRLNLNGKHSTKYGNVGQTEDKQTEQVME